MVRTNDAFPAPILYAFFAVVATHSQVRCHIQMPPWSHCEYLPNLQPPCSLQLLLTSVLDTFRIIQHLFQNIILYHKIIPMNDLTAGDWREIFCQVGHDLLSSIRRPTSDRDHAMLRFVSEVHTATIYNLLLLLSTAFRTWSPR